MLLGQTCYLDDLDDFFIEEMVHFKKFVINVFAEAIEDNQKLTTNYLIKIV